MGSILKISRVRLPEVVTLENGAAMNGLNLEAGYWRYYRIRVPEGQSLLAISATGAEGELDLFVRHGTLPARHGFDFTTGTTSRQRTARIAVDAPAAGDWYIGLFSWNYEGVTLNATYCAAAGAAQGDSPLTAALQSCCESVVSPGFARADEVCVSGKRDLQAAS